MRTSLILAAAAMLCVQGTVGAEDKRNNPEAVAGKVTKVDPGRNRVTMRDGDGTEREFEASKETIQDLKVGDRIEAKRRHESK
jgi:Cu/Ag efflux protein CusF